MPFPAHPTFSYGTIVGSSVSPGFQGFVMDLSNTNDQPGPWDSYSGCVPICQRTIESRKHLTESKGELGWRGNRVAALLTYSQWPICNCWEYHCTLSKPHSHLQLIKAAGVVETVSCWESRKEEEHEQMWAKYQELMEDCRKSGWKTRCIVVQMGTKAFADRSLSKAYGALGLTRTAAVRNNVDSAEKHPQDCEPKETVDGPLDSPLFGLLGHECLM